MCYGQPIAVHLEVGRPAIAEVMSSESYFQQRHSLCREEEQLQTCRSYEDVPLGGLEAEP